MTNKAAIFAGAAGGVAPNIVRLLVNYSSPSPQHLINQPVAYFLAMVGFAILGALVVWVFQEVNLKQALFLGIGLPSLFQIGTLQSAPSSSPPTSAPPLAGSQASFSLISSAYAQPSPTPAAAVMPGRKLNLMNAGKTPPYTVAFYGANNALIRAVPVTNSTVVDVPDDAVKFALQVGGSTSASYQFPAAAMVKAKVEIIEKGTSGFLQGVGLARAPHYDIAVRIE